MMPLMMAVTALAMSGFTIVIPGKSSMRLVARFDEPGKWMYHCHILEHGEAGMMGELNVE